MSDPGSESHPLFFHSIVMFVVAALVVTWGIVGIVGVAKAKAAAGDGAGIKAPGSIQDIQKAQQKTQATVSQTKQLGQKPTSVSGALSQAQSAQRLVAQNKEAAKAALAFIAPVLTILLGVLIGAAGAFVLMKANWARYLGFAAVLVALLYYTWAQSAAQLGVDEAGKMIDFAVWRPLVLLVISALAGKFLFDLYVEKFPPAEPAAA